MKGVYIFCVKRAQGKKVNMELFLMERKISLHLLPLLSLMPACHN